MISRIRIDAYGRSAQHCDDALNRYAVWAQEKFGLRCSFGERVLEHQVNEPLGSDFYYKGRITIHFELLTDEGAATHESRRAPGDTFELPSERSTPFVASTSA